MFGRPLCCVCFSSKTGKFCPVISQFFLPIHAPLDKSGSLLISTKSSLRISPRLEDNWRKKWLMIHLLQTPVQPKKNIMLLNGLHAVFLWSYLQAASPSAGKESPLWAAIENLQKGVSWHRTKPYLIFEVRYFQATTLGLPVEISKYYESVNGITVNGEETNHSAYDHVVNLISID